MIQLVIHLSLALIIKLENCVQYIAFRNMIFSLNCCLSISTARHGPCSFSQLASAIDPLSRT